MLVIDELSECVDGVATIVDVYEQCVFAVFATP
jgi:hypothetical protein